MSGISGVALSAYWIVPNAHIHCSNSINAQLRQSKKSKVMPKPATRGAKVPGGTQVWPFCQTFLTLAFLPLATEFYE